MGAGTRRLLKLGSRDNNELRELIAAVKRALAGKLFARAKAKQVEEAEFIRSVCEMDRSPIQHEDDEGGGGAAGGGDDSDDDL